MSIVFLVMCFAIVTACILKKDEGKEFYNKEKNSKEKFSFGRGFSFWIVEYFGLTKKVGAGTWKAIDNINSHENVEIEIKKHIAKKIQTCVLILLAVNVLGVFYEINSRVNNDNISVVDRAEPGQGDKQVSKKVIIDGKEENISFELSEREPKKEEVTSEIDIVKNYIDENLLGDNESYENVYKKLNLVEECPDSNAQISWITDEEGYINSDGSIERIKDNNGVIVSISALITYGEYEEEYIVTLRLVPDPQKEDTNTLLNMIEEENDNTRANKTMQLPDKIGNKTVSYVEDGNGKENILIIYVLGIIAIVLIFCMGDNDIRKKDEQRRQEMLVDYPEIITKLCILMRAGLTARRAWEKIACDYKACIGKNKPRFAYEEMYISWIELSNGMAWSETCENFKKRCDSLPYSKLSTWMVQNERKGSAGLIEMLENESYEAKEERNKVIKINGEKISQKLLIPMIGLMAIVMLIAIVPAFISFQ